MPAPPRRRAWPLAATVALLAACAAPAAATAAPDWAAPKLLPDDASSWQGPTALGVDAEGRATFGQLSITSISPVDTQARLLAALPGDPFAEQFGIGTGGGTAPAGVSLAVGADGSAAACLTEVVGSNPGTDPLRRRVLYRPAGATTWEAPAPLTQDTVRSGFYVECQPVVGPDGTAAVATRRTTVDAEPRRTQVFLTVHRPGGTWTAPQAVSGAGSTGYGNVVGVDTAGNVTIAWDERYAGNATASTADDLSSVKVATRAASNGVLGVAQTLTPEATRSAGAPRLAVGPDGTAVIGFQFNGSSATEYQAWGAARDGASGAWSAPQQLVSDAAASSVVTAVGVAPDRTQYLTYWRQATVSSDSQAGMIRRSPGGAFSGELGVGPKNTSYPDGGFAFLDNDAVFVFEDAIGAGGGDPGLHITEAIRWRAGAAAPDAARDLLPPGTDSQFGRVASDNQGGVFATFERYAAEFAPYGRTQVVAFDASPPRAVSVAVPATGTAGAAIAMAATFADLWSSVASTAWDFGDGTTGAGPSVGHTYAAPGTYTVTVTGVDPLGNARSVTRQISVGAPAPAGQGTTPVIDRTAPTIALTQPSCPKRLSRTRCAKRRAERARWRTLRGTVSDAGGSGVARVEVAIARRSGKRLYVLKSGRFRKGTAKAFPATVTRATVNGAAWSLRLPALARGTYLVRVRAVDGAGNASKLLARTLKLR